MRLIDLQPICSINELFFFAMQQFNNVQEKKLCLESLPN
ncbi:hypothetical protein LDG_6210 [Legionella drancourtii LLAP12]|uniref:Uncharacterized protein n=1 Tax=Legionella drancourtii LLAP12 TaxID=658187 RepID=G9ELV0_9GAMM|nr:hypothetical protein LDG_6210 [Legionella drancourtii LLAP12]